MVIERKPQYPSARVTDAEKRKYSAALVGDAQRAAAADYLGIAYAYGFIPREEHDKRMSEALTARTEDRLYALMLDLPSSIDVPDAVVADDTPPVWVCLLIAFVIAASVVGFAVAFILCIH